MISEGMLVQDVKAGRRAYAWVRYVLVALVAAATVLFFVYAAQATLIEVYVCDVPEPDGAPRQCTGLLDIETCTDLEASVCVRSTCGHQLAEHIDISVAGAPDPWAAGTPINGVAAVMVAWSFVPYALVLVVVAWLFHAADTASLACLILLLVGTTLNEVVIKNLVQQHRPPGSCLYFKSYGMPSGHAQSSVGMLVYLMLETWVDRPRTPRWHKAAVTSALCFLLAPVPYSRTYLNDHLPQQVIAGAAEGTLYAVCFFAFMYFYVRHRLDGWMSGMVGKVLFNTYRVPDKMATPVLPPPAALKV